MQGSQVDNFNKSEARSAACARKCGLRVCNELPPDYFVGKDNVEPLIVSPPDDSHPCAWGECPNGAKASDGMGEVDFQGNSLFSCSGDGTWRYNGPEAEKRHQQDIRCLKEQP
ncbi:hypothetical protein PENTCL1PPCAC_29704, partial [Pristionchus entomophagus]